MQRVVCRRAWGVAAIAVIASPAALLGNINIELRPATQAAQVGSPVNIGVWIVSDSANNQYMSAADIMFSWDETKLHLNGLSQTGATPLLISDFPQTDPWCNVNHGNPPANSPAYYRAWANFGAPVTATPSGTLLTTFQFTALADAAPTTVAVIPAVCDGYFTSIVYEGTTPNLDVTGTLGHADVTITTAAACSLKGDMNHDGLIDGRDIMRFAQVIINPPGGTAYERCAADINSDSNDDLSDMPGMIALLLSP